MKSTTDLTPPRLYTRRGDTGLTDCPGRGRVGKDDRLIEALGTLDELNAHLGLLAAELADRPEWVADVQRCQHELMALGATWVAPRADSGDARRQADGVVWLESRIDGLSATLPPLRQFVLPGGSVAAAQAHVCRTVCRRLERACVRAWRVAEAQQSKAAAALAASLPWLNRLSDYLFVAARAL